MGKGEDGERRIVGGYGMEVEKKMWERGESLRLLHGGMVGVGLGWWICQGLFYNDGGYQGLELDLGGGW